MPTTTIANLGIEMKDKQISPLDVNGDRRHIDLMHILHNYIFPAVLAGATAYMTVLLTINTLTLDMTYVKRDLTAQGVMLSQVTDNQLMITKAMASLQLQDRENMRLSQEITRLKDRVRALEKDPSL